MTSINKPTFARTCDDKQIVITCGKKSLKLRILSEGTTLLRTEDWFSQAVAEEISMLVIKAVQGEATLTEKARAIVEAATERINAGAVRNNAYKRVYDELKDLYERPF